MKTNDPWALAVNGIKRIFIGLVLAAGAMLTQPSMAAGPAPVDLGSAAHFTILAGTAITATGTNSIKRDVGLSPSAGTAITGLTAAQVNGIIYAVDGSGPSGSVMAPDLLTTAKNDLTTAYSNAVGRTVDSTVATELGGSTRTPGVYDSASGTFGITTGALTLDAAGDPDAVFIFKMATTLITADNSQVGLTNGAQARNVFWQVGSSATLGAGSVFKGTIMAQASITINTGSIMDGRALAREATVTFDSLVMPVSLSISVSPSTWAVGTVGMGTVNMSSAGNKISVTNNGNVAETFNLQISDEDDLNIWTNSPLKTGAGNNIYVLSGIFCAAGDSPGQGSFNQTDSEDVLTMTEQNATATQFTYADGTTNGVAVPADAGRSLWLRLDTPTAGTGGIEHTITVRVGCVQPL